MKLKQVMRRAAQVGSLVALSTLSAGAFAQVKIGFMATLSGPAAALGQDQYDGFMLGVEHMGGKLGGATIEVIKEDDQLKPDLGVQTIRKFLEKDQVDIVTGITFSNVMMAIAKPLADSGVTFISSNAGPAPLAGPSAAPTSSGPPGRTTTRPKPWASMPTTKAIRMST